MAKYSKRQLMTLAVFCIAQFCSAVCISLQAPFYPKEAEAKGATPSQYGFVFGVYELVVFLVSPLYGRYLNDIGVKLVNNVGIFTVGSACILFGFLDKFDDTNMFIGFSFAIRIVEASGAAAFVTAAFGIIAKEFPQNVGSAFASLETCFGLGLIVGPTMGGALYEVGGFQLPFSVVGGMLLAATVMVVILLPSQDADEITPRDSSGMMRSALSVPVIVLSCFIVFGAALSIGFLQATLEPHLRPLNLSPLQMGLMFVLNGALYAFSAPGWGYLCDKWVSPRCVYLTGTILIATAFVLVGPAPFLPLPISLTICIISLIVHGIGIGACLVGTFTGLHRDTIEHGFPDDITTYGMVSGLWTSAFALGCFVGPSAAGLLFDAIGFPWASQTVVGLHLMLFLITLTFICSGKDTQGVKEPLLGTPEEDFDEISPFSDEDFLYNSYGTIGTPSRAVNSSSRNLVSVASGLSIAGSVNASMGAPRTIMSIGSSRNLVHIGSPAYNI